MMEIINIPIDKIRPDPHQPRKSFVEDELEGMARSIRTTGIINPIEIDKKYSIVTGERRWRAAKMAGLKEVPCKIIDLPAQERFTRQVIENIHHNTMNDWDTAQALKRMIAWQHRSHPMSQKTHNVDQGIRWLSHKTGKSRMYISEKLGLLEASKNFQDAIRKGKLTSTHLRVLERAPKEFKVEIEKKLLAGEFKTSEAGLEVIGALRRNPANAEAILAKDYTPFQNKVGVSNAVEEFAPRFTTQIAKAIEPTDKLGDIVRELVDWLGTNTPKSVGAYNIRRVISNLSTAQEEITGWLKNN